MREEQTQQLYDILLHGLKLRDRVLAGDRPPRATEEARLKSMLGSAQAPSPWGGGHDPTRSVGAENAGSEFQGIRYALTCWLDEVLIDAGWREWDENKLENALYRTNMRYSNFWSQARLAEAIPGASQALEAFLLCTLLGFRGELGESPERLKEWVNATRRRVTGSLGKDQPPLPEKMPEMNVPPLTGIEAYKKMTQRLLGGLVLAVPIVAFFAIVMFDPKR